MLAIELTQEDVWWFLIFMLLWSKTLLSVVYIKIKRNRSSAEDREAFRLVLLFMYERSETDWVRTGWACYVRMWNTARSDERAQWKSRSKGEEISFVGRSDSRRGLIGYSLCMHSPSVQFLDWSTMPSQSFPPFLGAGSLHSLLLQWVHSVPQVDHLLHSVHRPSTIT